MFQVHKGSDGQWYWRLVAKNGETISDSAEGYRRRSACKNAIERVKAVVATAEIVERLG